MHIFDVTDVTIFSYKYIYIFIYLYLLIFRHYYFRFNRLQYIIDFDYYYYYHYHYHYYYIINIINISIPKHCFKHSYITSFSYLLSDLMMVVCFFYLAHYCDRAIGDSETAIPPYFKYLLWPVYWYAQGSVMTGIWVIGK